MTAPKEPMTTKEAIELLREELVALAVYRGRRANDAYVSRAHEAFSMLKAALEDYERVKAEVERLKDKLAEVTKLWSTAERDATHLYARMMKAEAELEKARPLLSAIDEARIYWDNTYTPITFSPESAKVVLGQAIEYASKNRKEQHEK